MKRTGVPTGVRGLAMKPTGSLGGPMERTGVARPPNGVWGLAMKPTRSWGGPMERTGVAIRPDGVPQ